MSHEPFVHNRDQLKHFRNDLANIDIVNYHDNNDGHHHAYNELQQDSEDDIIPSGVEQILIDSWLSLCPSLAVVTLFSGSQWRKDLDDRQELWAGIYK